MRIMERIESQEEIDKQNDKFLCSLFNCLVQTGFDVDEIEKEFDQLSIQELCEKHQALILSRSIPKPWIAQGNSQRLEVAQVR
jgi:hypothetical protein